MRCIAHNPEGKPGGTVTLIEASVPEVEAGCVLIRVSHAGVNRPDILQRQGLYPPPPGASPILGLEVSGWIEKINAGNDLGWREGDAVCALVNGGGYADYVAVDIRHLLPVPKGLGMAQAASLPEVAITVYANLIEHGALKASETVLVHGANSGIGSMTIMLGKAMGARVIATARGADKCAFAQSLGADLIIDTSTQDFVAATKAAGGADVVLDIVGGDFTNKNLMCLKPKGRLVQVGLGQSGKAEIELMRIMHNQLVLTGSTLRPRSADEKARLINRVREFVWPFIAAGKIRAVVDRVFDFTDVVSAHNYLEGGQQCGKVALRL